MDYVIENLYNITLMNESFYISLLDAADSRLAPGYYPQCAIVQHQDQQYHLKILHAGCVSFSSNSQGQRTSFVRGEHRHAVYHVVLFLENQDFFQINGQLHPAKPGILVITSPQDSHSFVPFYRHPVAYTEIAFEVSGEKGILELPFMELLTLLFGRAYKSPVFPISTGKRQQKGIGNQILILVKELTESNKEFTGKVALRFLGILNFLAEEFFEENRPVRSLRALAPLDLTRLEIERRYHQSLTIAELAEIAALSPNYFLTAFRRHFGTTPIQYQQDLRMKRAKWLLDNTSLSCQTIADEVGYQDIFFFSKFFKKVVGVSPTIYRNQNKNI
jgi:AraC-like DNA-binding protein